MSNLHSVPPPPDMAEPPAPTPRTLCIDIGGTGLKALVLGPDGTPLTERVRVPTPRPATPKAVLNELRQLIAPLGEYERLSVGFPGVVVEGTPRTAPNLHPKWADFPLARALEELTGRPTRVLNDAGVQGYGVITGHGLEMVLTLGTGMGCGLFHNGTYVPNLELAHHPLRKGKTYEEYLGAAALGEVGRKRWNRRVARALAQIQPIWNPDRLYLGGGNARLIDIELPDNVSVVENVAGLLGGLGLWRDVDAAARAAPPPAQE